MKPYRTLIAAVIVAAVAGGTAVPAWAADAHSHSAGAPAALALDHGKRWTTDAPLRLRMNEVRALMAPKIAATHAGRLARPSTRRSAARSRPRSPRSWPSASCLLRRMQCCT